MDTAIYRFDPTSRIHWLEFNGKPDQDTINIMNKAGWRFSGYRKQWHTNRRFAKPPVGIEYEDGGEVNYAEERPDRLANAATRASERSEQAYERSNALVEHIPFGQPVLVGHHSQRGHEKTLQKSQNAMSKSVEEQKKADHLAYKAKSSASHQAYKEKPDVIARRIKRLKGEITSINNQYKSSVMYDTYDIKNKPEDEQSTIREALQKHRQWADERIALIQAEIADNEQALKEAGGLVTDHIDIQVGDVIRGRWQGLCRVQKVNTRKGEVMSYTCEPLEDTWCRKRILPVTDVRGKVLDKENVTSESVLEAKIDAKIEQHTAIPEGKQEPQEKVFKVQDVQTVELYDNRTSVFPTPLHLAQRMAAMIPEDARLILEPSAGTGALINEMLIAMVDRGQAHDIHCCELLPQLQDWLQARYTFVASDFLTYRPDFQYDAIVANPPFKNTEWLDHVEHMLDLLKHGGLLVCIVPSGFVFRQDKRIKAFRDLVEEYGWYEELPGDTFTESGTNVNTVLLTLRKWSIEETE